MSESSAPESTTRDTGSKEFPHRRVPRRIRRDNGAQAETALTSTPTFAGDPGVLAVTDRRRQNGPSGRSTNRCPRRSTDVARQESVEPLPQLYGFFTSDARVNRQGWGLFKGQGGTGSRRGEWRDGTSSPLPPPLSLVVVQFNGAIYHDEHVANR